MPSTTVSASSVYVEFGYEGEFGGGSTSFPMLFGKEQKLTSLELNVNQLPLGQLYSPEIECYVYGKNEGSATVEYVLAQPFNLSSIFGAPFSEETGVSSGIFTHEWTSDPDNPTLDLESSVVATTVTDPGTNHILGESIIIVASSAEDPNADAAGFVSEIGGSGELKKITLTNSGYGYTSAPAITFTNGSGSADAIISPVSTRNIDTMALEIGIKSSLDAGDDFVRNIAGAISPTMSFRMSLNEPIRVTQELKWGIETPSATIDTSIGTNLDFTPYVFADAEIKVNGSVVATVQDFDLNINSNAELLWELGTANASGAWRKILEMTGKLNVTVKDASFYNIVAGRSEQTSMTVTITNGLSGTAEKSIVMVFAGIGFGTHNNTGIEPGELVLQNMDFQARTVKITATNDTKSQPI